MLIIPALDILDGKLVRLEKGDYQSSKTYSDNPFEIAKNFVEAGFSLIHIVDLSGAKNGRLSTIDLLKKIKTELSIKIQFGGGIRSLIDAQNLVNIGIEKIVIGSLSVTNKPEFEKTVVHLDPGKIICALDFDNEKIKIKGWTEFSSIKIYDHIKYCMNLGVDSFLCTDISKDGMLTGPNINFYKAAKDKFPEAKIIASGGVSSINDLMKLKNLKLFGVVVGKAIYENKIKLKELIKIVG
ncbi:MAG: 1-(5-phosphoribosyl)-5-[(5-phosphoribosylamino)methylideneamino]imidazole-4-carboxamide isomerase [Ignavibacteriaceae bacterium]|nr:1-(5-phosphoribosyl)-5-[(5-phosphoribosylamino)methylideneamino]imidazole-4-carboxamide isomerase [Ignavibacteriaceae bacterium]